MGAEPAIRLTANRRAEPASTEMAGPPRPDGIIAFPVVVRVAMLLDAFMMVATSLAVTAALAPQVPAGQAVVGAAVYLYATLAALRGLSAYRATNLSRFSAALRIVVLAGLAGLASFAGVLALLRGTSGIGAGWILVMFGLSATVMGIARGLLCLLLALWRATGRLTRHVAIVGANDYSRSFIEAIQADPAGGLSIVGIYDDRLARVGATHASVPVLGNVGSLIADARERRIDVIVVALPLSASERIAQLRGQLSPTVTDIFLTADTAGLCYDGRDFEALGRNGVIRVASRPLSDWDAALKSCFDRVAAAALLLLLSPLLATIGVLIRLDSPGPALFRQPRTGFNNRPFPVLKFRTMYRHLADLHADQQTTRGDHRVTKLGRFLRRSSLDELPQLVNVVRGDMSLVGPRPHAANTKAENRLFDEVVADYALRHRLKPGITGWAQVNGWRGETARIEQIEQRVAYDLAYIENWSLLLDLKILAMTAFRGFGGQHAY